MPARDSDSDFDPGFDPADEPAESTYQLKPPESAADEDLSGEVPAAGNDLRDENPPPRQRKRKRPRERDSAVPTLSPPRIGDPRSRPPPAAVSLVSSLWYPLTGYGVCILTGLSIFVSLAFLVPIPILDIIVRMIVGLFVAMLFLETANFTLEQIPARPRFPLFDGDSLPAAMYGLTTLVIARIPQILGFFIMLTIGEIRADVMMYLLAAGLVYVPMGFLALAELQNERALNPIRVLTGMKRMGVVYFGLVALAAVAFLVPGLLMVHFKLHWIPQHFISTLLLLYTMTALMRAVAIVFQRRGLDFD